ncbi:MAG TPA: hypothetical protein P5228_11855 [Bacteroidales bacterium]|nr:hypothetical protein [Bacteroidales bacterium]HRZ49767.1 hypothetical protein [Bacteroidales bacterium]
MKSFIVSLLLIATVLPAMASTNPAEDVDHFIRSEISYPTFALRNQEEGFVMVNFCVDTLGNITVKLVNSDNPVLSDYVVKKMETLKVPCTSDECHDYSIRIEFRLK